tara:strand:+ start:728 stop:925 length:198 start_codon:yes stop_codon:yes gene_type:complete
LKYVITKEERQAMQDLRDARPSLAKEIRDMIAEISRLENENKVLKSRIRDLQKIIKRLHDKKRIF